MENRFVLKTKHNYRKNEIIFHCEDLKNKIETWKGLELRERFKYEETEHDYILKMPKYILTNLKQELLEIKKDLNTGYQLNIENLINIINNGTTSTNTRN